MERGRSLLIFKVKGHLSRSLGLYKEFWHLDPCGQVIARTIWPRMLELSVSSLYGKRKKPINFQGQRSNFKVTEPLQRILALGSLWVGLVCILNMERGRSLLIFKVKGHISRSLDGYLGNFMWFKTNYWFKLKIYMSSVCCYTQCCSCWLL